MHRSGGRLAFGTNPFTTASKGRETVMIEGRIGAESFRDGIKVGGGISWLLVFAELSNGLFMSKRATAITHRFRYF